MKEFNFTKEDILKLDIPTNKMEYYQDKKETSLKLYITTKGNITFFIRKTINRVDKRIVIGKFPEISITKAREIAFRIKSKIITGGIDLFIKEKKEKGITFEKIFTQYIEKYSKKEKLTWKYDKREIAKHFKHLFNMSASRA